MSLQRVLLGQFGTAWALAEHHLATLTTEECLWRPAAAGLHVVREADGGWRAEWPEHERYTLGPPSIAWTSWHLGWWWTTALDRNFGAGTLEPASVRWPGSADAMREWLAGLAQCWRAAVGACDDEALAAANGARWPYASRPLADVVAWANVELTKNAAEIGYARFLYAVRVFRPA